MARDMSGFSASDAALEGFHVLRRHWRVVVGWAIFNVMAMVAMVIVTVMVTVPLVLFAASDHAAAGTLGGVVGGVVAALGTLMVQVVIITGLYRLMLRDDPPEFLHLRLGGDEFRVVGTLVLLGLLAMPLFVVGVALVAAASKVSGPVAILAGAVLAIAFYGLAVRVGLTPVVTFMDRRVRIAAGWRLSRGHGFALLGMALLTVCLVALIAVVVWIALYLLGGTLTGFQDQGLAGREQLAAHPGRYILQITAELLLAPIFLVLTQAPWIAAYRALTSPEAAS